MKCILIHNFFIKVRTLSGEADRLKETHPEQTEDITAKQAEITQNWERLKDKVNNY